MTQSVISPGPRVEPGFSSSPYEPVNPPVCSVEEINLVDPDLYQYGDPHAVWRLLREQAPVFWNEQGALGTEDEGFWAVTRYPDIYRVLRDAAHFSSTRSPFLDVTADMIGEDAMLNLIKRPISDTLAALILHNLFARFPSIRVMSIENGAGWVPALLRGMDKAWRSAKGRTGIGGEVVEKPSDVFRRNVFISPFPEDDIPALMDRIGADRVLFGSDYPHPEGMAEPADFADEMAGRDPAEIRLVMRDNNAALLGL